jgi:hypothetical protein
MKMNWKVTEIADPTIAISELSAEQLFVLIRQAVYDGAKQAGLELQSSRADAVARLLKG